MSSANLNPRPGPTDAGDAGTWRAATVPSGLPTNAAFFTPDLNGATQAGNYVARAVRQSGLPWMADRAALAAYLPALWLARVGPAPHPISVSVAYSEADQLLRIWASDDGNTLLPGDLEQVEIDYRQDDEKKILAKFARLANPDLLTSLAEHVDRRWSDRTPTGRLLGCEIKVRRAYRACMSWLPDTPTREPQRPEYGYDEYDTAEEARRHAAASLGAVDDGMRLVAVHLQGPEDFDDAWTQIAPIPQDSSAGAGDEEREDERPLPPDKLAEITKAALRTCSWDWDWWRLRRPWDLAELLRSAMPGTRFSAARQRQIAQYVVGAMSAEGPAIRNPLLSLVAAVHSHRGGPLSGMQQWLGAAWFAWDSKQKPATARRLDPYEQADQLSLAGCYHVLARDRYTGAHLIAPELCGLGTAGAVLAECLLAERIRIGSETRSVFATDSTNTAGLSMTALSFVATVRATKQSRQIDQWLTYLAMTADAQIEGALLEAGILVPAEQLQRRRLRSNTGTRPARTTMVDRIVSRTSSLARGRVEDGVLLALVRATGLERADTNTWHSADSTHPEPLLSQAGQDVVRLIEDVAAAVTTEVANACR